MDVGEINFDDETFIHVREFEPTICVGIEYAEVEAYTYINKEQAKNIVSHLTKVFKLSK